MMLHVMKKIAQVKTNEETDLSLSYFECILRQLTLFVYNVYTQQTEYYL